MKGVFKFIDEQVAKGYNLLGDRRPLAEMICNKFGYTNRNTVTNYISKYCIRRGYPMKRDFYRYKPKKMKETITIEKRIFEGQKVQALISSDRNKKAIQYNGKILVITDRIIVLALDVGYNIAVNIGDLIDPFNIVLKIKEDGEYKAFNLKGYSINNNKFTLKSLCKEC